MATQEHDKTPKCPGCGSIIYSRRNVLCGVCGKRLPEDLLFTPEKRHTVERDLDELKRRERASRSKEEEEAKDPTGGPIRDPDLKRLSKHHPILAAGLDLLRPKGGE
jgi:hypothetical protein